MSDPAEPAALAARLIDAAGKRSGIESLTTTAGPFDIETAYQVQDAVFVLRADLAGMHVTAAQVLAATGAVYPAIDVLDSRFAGYSFTLPDVIADNASGAGFVLSGQATNPAGFDPRLTGIREHDQRQ